MSSRGSTRPGTGPGSRQAGGGGGTSGALKRGNTGGTTTSSIPSKYETLINTGAKAKDGFGSRTYRMTEGEAADMPGPGAYVSVGQLSHMSKQTDSLSKKGYGNGFVSGGRRLPRDPSEYFRSPGPGAYDTGAARMIVAKTDFNRSKSTGAFAKPLENVGPPLEPRVDNRPGPGPGAYTPGSNISGGTNVAVKGAFRSGTDRFGERASASAASTPSPGTYNVHVVASSFNTRSRANNAGVPSAAFKSTSQRSSVGGVAPARRIGMGAPSIIYDGGAGELAVSAAGATPGPGNYGYGFDRDETAYRLLLQRAGKSSAAFARSTDDRFGTSTLNRATKMVVPGPGEYRRSGAFSDDKAVTGPFKSTSNRPDPNGHKAELLPPGPAYYKPANNILGKKSFHLNAHKRFV